MEEDFPDAEEYRVNGVLHRLDGPAVIWSNGMQEWWQNGMRHRTDGPAIIFASGEEQWYQNDKRHRIDGPAIKYIDSEAWYKNDKLHRLDGPAVYRINNIKGTQKYFINGKEMNGVEHAAYIRNKLKRKNNKMLLEMMKTTFLTLKQSQIDTGENDNYYQLPKSLVLSIIEKIESSS